MDFGKFWGGAAAPYQIEQSLRFDGSQYLTRTPSSAGNRRTWTMSMWVKYGDDTNTRRGLFGMPTGANNNRYVQWYIHSYNLKFSAYSETYRRSDAFYRDHSAWYHVVLRSDTTQSSEPNRLRIYVNGELITARNTSQSVIDVPQNHEWGVNNTDIHYIGTSGGTSEYLFKGYIAEFYLIDGSSLAPTSFGEFDDNDVWRPIAYSGSYGTNGVYLKFDPSATNGIGHDHSGNGNNYSPTGFTTSGTLASDVRDDTPTNNYATWNPIFRSNTVPTYSDGNLSVSGATTSVEGTLGVSEGKWYYECTMTGGGSQIVGICGPLLSSYSGNLYDQNTAYVYQFQGKKGHNGTLTNYGSSYGNNDVIGIAFDADNGTITFYKNGSSQGQAFSGISGTFLPAVSNNGNAATHNANFGESTFAHTPPTGYKAWATANMPEVDIKNPSDHFRVITGSGSSILTSAQSAFSNGLWWIKDLANSNQHQLVDSVRGSNLRLTTPNETTEATYSAPSGNSIAFCWNLVSDRSNGFDIVTYSGNSSNRTVAHNLGVQPEFLMVCNRNRGGATHRIWTPFYSASETLEINTSRSKTTENTVFNNTAPTSSVFSLGNSSMNATNYNYVAYLWRSVPGYSLISGFNANGVSNGVFVYCGFRPAFIMYKPYNATANWGMRALEMSPYNPSKEYIYANGTSQQYNAALQIDILSNGFKWREDGGQGNDSGQQCVFMAFAEHPFGGDNVSPGPAR